MKLEILLAVWSEAREWLLGLIIIWFICLVGARIGQAMAFHDDETASGAKLVSSIWSLKYFILVFILLTLVPSLSDIWRVRIDLIKYKLASPENIQKGTEEIIKIGKALEAQYLGLNDSDDKK